MTDPVKRPFWLHQVAEYVVGVALVASGLQSPSPAVPAALGGLVLLNAACADAPLGAFRVAGRRLHRALDVALVAIGVAATAFSDLDPGTRIVQGCCIFVYVAVVVNTDYSSRAQRSSKSLEGSPHGGRADEFGRSAGRVVGTVAAGVRRKWRSGRVGEPDSDRT